MTVSLMVFTLVMTVYPLSHAGVIGGRVDVVETTIVGVDSEV